jgi:hypothetical protein
VRRSALWAVGGPDARFRGGTSFRRAGFVVKDRLLLGLGRHMIPVPRTLWRRVVASGARKTGSRTAFMTDDHHRVRDFAVTALPRVGAPLAPEAIAEALHVPLPRVVSLLDDLESP